MITSKDDLKISNNGLESGHYERSQQKSPGDYDLRDQVIDSIKSRKILLNI